MITSITFMADIAECANIQGDIQVFETEILLCTQVRTEN